MRTIKPLGEQIIIKVFPPDQIGSIIVPDSAKGITQTGAKGPEDAVHFVEAEVVAVGPGKRGKGDKHLVSDLAHGLQLAYAGLMTNPEIQKLFQRAENGHCRLPLQVKPGDRILYHPAVQRFDRRVEGLGEGEFYIIREESVLAILEK